MKAHTPFRFHPGALPCRIACWSSLVVLTALAACAMAPPKEIPPANASLPMPLQVGPDEILRDVFTAAGKQAYSCRRTADGLIWRNTGTEASLFDAAQGEVGAIVSGDYFTAHDDSIFAGRVADEVEMAPATLPWQRIVKRYTAGSPERDGRLTQITSIQRVSTSGGIPPASSCSIEGQSLFVPYSATYLLYRHVNAAAMTGGAEDVKSTPMPQ